MNAAQSDLLRQAEALTAHVDSLARGAVLGEDALASLAATLRAARVVARALDGETRTKVGADAAEEVMSGGTGDAVFRTAILALATKLIGRIRKITPSRHEATRKARVLIKAIALYLLFAKTDPSTLAGRCEHVKASAKVALDLFTEANDGAGAGSSNGGAHDLLLAAETLAAASYCVDAFVALEKEAAAAAAATMATAGGAGGGGGKGLGGQLPAGEVEAVAIGVSKALEVLLALTWRGTTTTTTTTPQGEQHPHPQQQRDTMEMARRVEALLRAALLRPALLGKRAVTVSGDVARRLSKAGQLRPARDCLVAALQALESMGTSGGGGEGWKRTAQSALQWLLSECYSQLGDTEKALSGLYVLEALQKAEAAAAAAEEGGAGGGGAAAVIPVHKVELAKIAFLLRGRTTEGLRAARACVLGLASASAGSPTDSAALLQAALKGARALVGFSRYTPESFAVFDEIEKQAHGSSSPSNSSSLGPVARARALVLSTALQSTAAASPARQQVLLAQLVQVLAPLTASPAAAAALGARDRERLRTAVRQAIWSNPLDFAAAAAASSAPDPSSGGAEEDGGDGHDEGGRKRKAQWWGQVTALCDALLALLEPGDAAGKEQALCTQSHALLELGRHDAAFTAAQRACGLLPAAGSGSDATTTTSSLLATAGSSKARANLCWVACLVALKQAQQRAAATTTTTTGDAAGEQQQQQPQPHAPARSPVLVVLQALVAAPVPSGASSPSSARLSGLLELATLVAEVVAPAAPALAARQLKSVLEEVLRVWLEGTTTSARPGSKRGRPGSAPSTSASSASFPLSVPLPAPTGGGGEAHHDGDDDAMDTTEEKPQQQKQGPAVGFFAVCRALLEATLRCALGGKDGGGVAAAASYPAEAFADAGAARECWRAVALFALPGLDKLQQALQRQQQEGGAAEAITLPKSLREDLRWLSALCTNLATGVGSSNTHPNPGPANSTPTAGRHDLLVAAYRFFEAAVTLPPTPAAVAEADERRRVVLLMLAVSASLAVRTENEGGVLSGRERSYWLAQLGEIRSRTAALSKTPALMPLARNLAKTAIVLELMVRGAAASSTSSGSSSGGEDGEGGAAAVGGGTTGLAQLLGREELLALPVEVLHALARACQDPAASPASEGNVAARKIYRLALKQATAQAQQQPAGAGQAAAQAQCFWLYLDLFQAAPTQSAALIVAKEFKQRADGYRPGAQEEGEGEGEDTPLVALRTVAARLAVAMYNEGVARLELVQADASVCVEAALALLPYAEESFQASFKDTMESMLSVAQELRSTEVGAVTASLLAGEGVDGGEEEGGGGKGGGVALASAAAAAMGE